MKNNQDNDYREFYLVESDYYDIFHLASDAIWIHDLKGNIIDGNDAFAEMLCQPIEKLRGRNVRDFLSGSGLIIASDVKKKLFGGAPAVGRYEQRVLRSDGQYAIVEIASRLIARNGKAFAFQNFARDVTEQRETEERLKFYTRRILEVHEEERKILSRDLHDDTIQSLLVIIHRLDAIVSQLTPQLSQQEKREFDSLRSLVEETLKNLRRRTQELRPVILDDLGLPASLEWLADRLGSECGITVGVNIDAGIPVLPHDVQLVLFRTAQEALSNIRKHSKASRAYLKLEMVESVVRLTIIDNGIGFVVPANLTDISCGDKLGLLGMQERALLARGLLTLKSDLGKGTVVVFDIPFPA